MTLAWAALFGLSILLQYSAGLNPVRASEVSAGAALPADLAVAAQGCGYVPLDIELIIDK